jgi:hypothetical protein
MASIRTGLIGVTVLAFVALQSCSSSKNDDDQGTPSYGGWAGTGVAMTGGISTTPQGGAVATGGNFPQGTLSCSNRLTCSHPFCTEGAALDKMCAPCAYKVCDVFPLCCIAMWDANCMLQAQIECNCACGVNTGGAPASTGGRPPTGGSGGTGGGIRTGGAGGSGAGGASTDGGSSPGGADTGGAPPATGGSDPGGSGGAGGSGTLTLAEACAAVCDTTQDASLADCNMAAATCETGCTGYMDADPLDPDNYPLMVQCLATLTASQWECTADPTDGTMFGAIPVGDGPCETDVCLWTCTDGTLVDPTAYTRCNC